MTDTAEAVDRLNAIKAALDEVMRPTRPLYVPTAVELMVSLNARGLKIWRANERPAS